MNGTLDLIHDLHYSIIIIRGGSRNSGWGGGVDFFCSKAWGLGAALRPPMGPGGGPGGRSPLKLLNFSDFTSKI